MGHGRTIFETNFWKNGFKSLWMNVRRVSKSWFKVLLQLVSKKNNSRSEFWQFMRWYSVKWKFRPVTRFSYIFGFFSIKVIYDMRLIMTSESHIVQQKNVRVLCTKSKYYTLDYITMIYSCLYTKEKITKSQGHHTIISISKWPNSTSILRDYNCMCYTTWNLSSFGNSFNQSGSVTVTVIPMTFNQKILWNFPRKKLHLGIIKNKFNR